jgi:hypothetical protein
MIQTRLSKSTVISIGWIEIDTARARAALGAGRVGR